MHRQLAVPKMGNKKGRLKNRPQKGLDLHNEVNLYYFDIRSEVELWELGPPPSPPETRMSPEGAR